MVLIEPNAGTFTPYSSVMPLVSGTSEPLWAPELEKERVASYQKYEEIYWNAPMAFKVWNRDDVEHPIYIPNGRTVADATSHFLLKGLELKSSDAQKETFEKFLKRERFYSMFEEAKHSGVVRGDYVIHVFADPNKPPGKRITMKAIDPGSWFPVTADEDPDIILGHDIIDQIIRPDGQTVLKRQRYEYISVGQERRVISSVVILDPHRWWVAGEQRVLETRVPPFELDSRITTIPVYAFKNIGWQGRPYGTSELAGHERLLAAVSSNANDEDIALALEGIGVYHTDAPAPTNDAGEEEPWVIAPGYVAETPKDTVFERVDGVGSVKPFQDHIKYMEDSLFEASSTFRGAALDVAVAQSGIALAIRFLPTIAKLERRERDATDVIQQMFFDWGNWMAVYESDPAFHEFEVQVELGKKLPEDPAEQLNELNNMIDRGVISHQYYREQMTEKFGYVFPPDIEAQITKEKEAQIELAAKQAQATAPAVSDQSGTKNRAGRGAPGRSNRSNNQGKPNESRGTEAK